MKVLLKNNGSWEMTEIKINDDDSELQKRGITIGAYVMLNDNVKLGNAVKIGDCTIIGENAIIGDNVQIGDWALVCPDVTIADDVVIDSNVIIDYGENVVESIFVTNGAEVEDETQNLQ